MCLYLASAGDDAPADIVAEIGPPLADLHRDRDLLHAHGGNVLRMVDAVRSGADGWPPVVRRTTIAAARNALEESLKRLDAVQAEVLPGERRGIRTGFPVVTSAGG